MANLKITLADLNGDHYLGSSEGENLRYSDANLVWGVDGVEYAKEPLAICNFTLDKINDIYTINAAWLHGLKAMSKLPAEITEQDIIRIALFKTLHLKYGLVSPNFLPETNHVDYSEFKNESDLAMLLVDPKDPKYDANMVKANKPFADVLNEGKKYKMEISREDFLKIRNLYTDCVCMVACVFRQRGHHYTDTLNDLYARLWKKCRYEENMLPVSFRFLATYATHAVYPKVLDDFWLKMAKEGKVNGALAKRIDSAPAGAAGPYVIEQGLYDLKLIAPGVEKVFDEASTELKTKLDEIRKDRWNGSVNARYYGAKRIVVNEQKLGGIAATIYAALANLTDDAPLLKSAALKRIAQHAPITGAVLAKAIGKVAERKEVTDQLVIGD